ncbi:carboxymuconolactone decarboxylase family protein [Nocardia sp. CA2R105]|uniref:carboxymuconolactone decarboxylase family protein n=1 Tax=Nocardia coffeae TaxID=2873381 RepID=UPI001CA709C3|nr:carboxymuconolactone decarboxylase family protein [Nocardia coffeae]MBY8859257.1 carboxymuconolactone decarboxylase family protein [Nocardia coffeae]
MKNPARILPDTQRAIQALTVATRSGGVPEATLELVHIRASQINGCGFCVDNGVRSARANGESEDRLAAVAVWRGTPYFTDAERAALDLAEHATRLADRSDAVPDAVWDNAASHYDEKALAALVVSIATTNFFNRILVTTEQVAGSW